MKTGEYWKIGSRMWCQITKKEKSSFHFVVINGDWDGRYDPGLKRVYVEAKKQYFTVESIEGPLSRKQVQLQCGY